MELSVMALVLIGYFVFLFRASKREYRDVIDEKFGDGK
jgi:cbb3-type cytochrome oxidase subunit 3